MSAGDRVEIRQLRALGHHGAVAGEQDQAQPFEIDLDIYLDLDEAAGTDDLTNTADYGAITLKVAHLVLATRFHLLESLAGAIAEAVLGDTNVTQVDVTVRKLRPPIAADVATVGVRLSRAERQPVRGA